MVRVFALFLVLLSAWPAQARFLSADPVQASADQQQYFNRHHYAGGNPFKYRDPDGRVLDTVLDVGFAAYSAYTLVREPSWRNAGALGADVAAMFLPGVTGAGVAVRGMGNGVDLAKAGSVSPDATVYRQGTSKESPTRLNNQSGLSEASNIQIHGVSGSTTPLPGACSTASCSELRAAGFEVHATPSKPNPNHVTIEMPKPVTKDDAKRFNDVFRRAR